MTSTATSKSEADAHIEILRKARGVNERGEHDTGVISSSLNDTLKMCKSSPEPGKKRTLILNSLSDQLYHSRSHFLLELIQNADDNTFARRVTPSFHFTLSSTTGSLSLRTDCNEVGFTFQDIDSISQSGRSTKKQIAGRDRVNIGEKGIGFKSVFKVADVVSIASGYYEFSFDRRAFLGMILPISSPFPREQRLQGHTQFMLHLRGEDDFNNIQDCLRSIEPQLLIFLRKLRVLNIHTNHIGKKYRIDRDASNTLLGEIATISSQGSSGAAESKYLVTRQDARELPEDPSRPGITTSEVVLAFPIEGSDRSNSPGIRTQKVFAHLPIDDFGFKFLIHADFLLVASREALDYGSVWNLALRRPIQEAFVTAITRFANMPPDQSGQGLRYGWPKYLRHHRSSHDFWNELSQATLRDLRGRQVIESQIEGRHCQPHELRFVPRKFRYEGKALFDSLTLQQGHLSFNYDGVYSELTLLGVQQIRLEDLAREFSTWIKEKGILTLGAMDVTWHRTVASLFSDQTQLKNALSELPIIPLRGGTWVSANTPHLYLQAETGDEYLPACVDISIVDECASQDPVRRRFYQFLGLKVYTPKLVCDLILRLHRGQPSSVTNRTAEDLIRDAAYLFKHRSLLGTEGAPEIYFLVKNQGSYSRRNCQIYVVDEADTPGLIGKYKATRRNPFHILDEAYENFYAEDEITKRAFKKWLLQSEHISTVPILIRNHHLTPEWAFLREQSVVDLLLVVEKACQNATIFPHLSQAVKELQVESRDHHGSLQPQPLAKLAIPTQHLLRTCPHISYADLAPPESWTFLEKFGIPTVPGTTTILRELDALVGLPIHSVDRNLVHECYRGLNRSPEQHKRTILQAFMSKPLVLVNWPQLHWAKRSACVWNAPSALKQVTKLVPQYRDCQRLFCDYLGVESANIKNVVDELCTVHQEPSEGIVQRCEELLTTLKRHLPTQTEFGATQFLRLRHAKVFPVMDTQHVSETTSEAEVELKSIRDPDWYIPDRLTLELAFRGKVNLLKFSVKSVISLEQVFSTLKCQNLYLSFVVKETVIPQGSEVPDLLRERDLARRLLYISSLDTTPSATLGQSCRNLRVWSVSSIVMIRRLGLIEIVEDSELVTFKEDDYCTNIYFRALTAQSRQPDIIFKLADFFSRQCVVESEDMNLFILLLSTPLEDLDNTMAQHNRFISERLITESTSSDQRLFNQPHSSLIYLTEEQHSEIPRRSHDSPDTMMSTEDSSAPIETPVSGWPVSSQRLLQQLIPSFESRSRIIANNARKFRISKHHIVRGSDRMRRRRETRQRVLDSDLEDSILPIISQQIQVNMSTSVAGFSGNGEASRDLPAVPSPEQLRTREIGFRGEVFIHNLFDSQIDDWSYDHWTSRLRVENGHPPFTQLERNFSDFTYVDNCGHMRRFLERSGVDLVGELPNGTTYHLEVKATTGACNQPFRVSQNQVDMMRKFDKDPNNPYILLRVFGVDSDSQGLKLYPSPWSLCLDGVLGFSSAGGYDVIELQQSLP